MTRTIWTDRGYEKIDVHIPVINIALSLNIEENFTSLFFTSERDYENFIWYMCLECEDIWKKMSSSWIWIFGTDTKIDKNIQWLRNLKKILHSTASYRSGEDLLRRAKEIMIVEIRGMVK